MLKGLRSVHWPKSGPCRGIGLAAHSAAVLRDWPVIVDVSNASPLSVEASQTPSAQYPLGTDRQGRDILAVMIAGTPLTLRIGVLAGVIGLSVGTALAFISAYYRGAVDTVIKLIVDVGLTVPGLLVLVIIAVSLHEGLTVNQMALVVAAVAWIWPARTIRAQVLTLRERAWVQVARLSGMSGPEIIVWELIPNLLPFLAAGLSAPSRPRSWRRSVSRPWGSDPWIRRPWA